jgi:glyoxylase-like metal-dependent hydrolase (beta-lactamase superfamily II)
VLKQVADGVFVHESSFLKSNAVVVEGPSGVLLVDPGILGDELAAIADDLAEMGQRVVAGFSTHPHWDHMLWDARFGRPPRYGTARGTGTARARLSDAGAHARVKSMMPPDIVAQVPLDLLGDLTGLPADATVIPWDGPRVKVIEHDAHAPGHAGLLIENRGVLVAGDMLSDILIPLLDLSGAADPVGDYLDGLQRLNGVADKVDLVIPGHGSIGRGDEVRARIERDRTYVEALRDGCTPDDPRLGPSAPLDWLAGVHERQAKALAERTP